MYAVQSATASQPLNYNVPSIWVQGSQHLHGHFPIFEWNCRQPSFEVHKLPDVDICSSMPSGRENRFQVDLVISSHHSSEFSLGERRDTSEHNVQMLFDYLVEGLSRSATVIAAYCYSGPKALPNISTASREQIWPNSGFRLQFVLFELSFKGISLQYSFKKFPTGNTRTLYTLCAYHLRTSKAEDDSH
ncbi:hypothetical protein F5876DRAFT_62778 [Lentinula aff. lateritia]|uniref:Uncharacterized protein n=1 Tax=Lentinula aff. lateritia TaxID=2804960 RepID=A0ACC1UAT2_9AGAR|nr:hypothetical protein F5876DRAFT_62778 [Lentinula aff. lateritia]